MTTARSTTRSACTSAWTVSTSANRSRRTSPRRTCSKRPRSTPTTWDTRSARAWPSSRSSRCSGSSRWRSWPGPRPKPSWRIRSASCPKNTRTPTVTGWKTSRTGASRASCGGDSAFRPTTCPRAGTSWPRRPKRRSQRRVLRPATTRCSRATCVRTRMCWTLGSRRGSGRFRSSTASVTRTIRK